MTVDRSFIRDVLPPDAWSKYFCDFTTYPRDNRKNEGSLTLQDHAREEDVRRYLDGQIFRPPRFVTGNLDLQEEIKAGIIKSVDGMCVRPF